MADPDPDGQSLDSGLAREALEARQDAKLLLLVVRTRIAQGEVTVEHAERLAVAAQDERLPLRRRRMAAQYLARMGMCYGHKCCGTMSR